MLYFGVCCRVKNKKYKVLSTWFVLWWIFFLIIFCVAVTIIINNTKMRMRFCTARCSTCTTWVQNVRLDTTDEG